MLGFVIGFCSAYIVEKISELYLFNKFKTEEDLKEYQKERDAKELAEFRIFKKSWQFFI